MGVATEMPGQERKIWRSHHGRLVDLNAVVEHYNSHLGLALSVGEKTDLVEFLKSL